MGKPTLIIFTEGHPNIDTGFITLEVNIICKYFAQIIIYPIRWESDTHDFKFEQNISFRQELANYLKTISSTRKKLSGLSSGLFWRSVFKVYPSKIKSLLNTCGFISLLGNWISNCEYESERTIFYSYWLVAPALALSRLKEKNKILWFISRAHGFDLYNERGDFIINYFKPYIFNKIDRVFCVSVYGKKYLENHYPVYSDKFRISRLGTYNLTYNSVITSESFEIVSCSSLSQVKRIDLLINGIVSFQYRYPSVNLRWVHIGAGPLFDKLLGLANQKLKPQNFQFTGLLRSAEIFDLYSAKSFKCFINVSESEGLPVSIMEAQSFGIPVIATAVGGTPEIVNNENGFLLPANPTPDEIASAIYDVVINKEKWEKKRLLSRTNWEENFNAEKNYREFGRELMSLINEKQL